jgi:2,5-diamino-6-(ribosylamino)-4(3H)-pyrimidinone 5'-phosphate reductase
MAMDRPETTLFLLVSVDGKISTGAVDARDVDKDFPLIPGVREGLHQYYELEGQTDLYSLNSGKVMAKIGVNRKTSPEKSPVSFIIIDNLPHLTMAGVRYMADWGQKLFLVSTNAAHPAFRLQQERDDITLIHFAQEIDFSGLLHKLKEDYGIEKLTIQSGGTLNAQWVRQGLVDHLSLVVAPCLVGGRDTPTLMDGVSLVSEADLGNIKALKLVECDLLNDSYLHLKYDLINKGKS